MTSGCPPTSESPEEKGQREGLQRLLIGSEDPLEKLELQRPEPLERLDEFQLEHAVERAVLEREFARLDRRRPGGPG